jgi:hypothetical protein
MQTSTPRRAPRGRRLAGFGAAALLAVPTALIATAPAHAAQPDSAEFISSSATEWIVPPGVRELTVTATGGSGGTASGAHGGAGGLGASVESVLTVEPGDVFTVWAGAAGADAGTTRTASGAGGAGFQVGGNGATSGALGRPGAGGGGSSAVSVDGAAVVIAGGGGGGGGRGLDDVLGDACRGGAGGAAGSAGANSLTLAADLTLCSTQTGGTAGADATATGANASNVPTGISNVLNVTLGGSGGGGAGAGGAGSLNASGFPRTAGGGGGGGGASLGDTIGVATSAGNGRVEFTYDIAYETTLEINPSPVPAVIGEDVSFTAVVENTETDDDSPTGEITFDFDGTPVTVPLVATGTPNVATATIEYPATALGTLWVDASYTPAAGSPFAESAGSQSYEVARGDSRVELRTEPADPTYAESTRATAKVSVVAPAVSTPDGVVVFWYGDQLLGQAPVDPVTGEASVVFPANRFGEQDLFAAYANDTYLYNSDDLITLTTTATSSVTTLKAGATEVAKGGAVKLDATVTAPAVSGGSLPDTGAGADRRRVGAGRGSAGDPARAARGRRALHGGRHGAR